MKYSRKKKSGSREKTPQERIVYDELEKSAPGAGTTDPQETREVGSLHENITTTEYVPQRERHRVQTPDEVQAARKTTWISWVLPIVVTLILAMIGLAFWAGKLQTRIDFNDSSIEKIENRVDSIGKHIDERINELRMSMAKIESDNALGKNTHSDYQTLKSELANLQQVVKNMEAISEKRSDEIRQLTVRMGILEKTPSSMTK